MNPAQQLIDAWIRRYQRRGGGLETFRVDCNFTPSCSEYTRQAVLRFGSCRGLLLGWRRIRRCTDPDCVHPVPDPVPAQLPAADGARAPDAGPSRPAQDAERG